MAWAYSQRSIDRLTSCHPDLQLLMVEALADPECPCDISIIEGHRTKERQDMLKDQGKSQLSWPHSRHNSYPSLAVDIAPYIGGISWVEEDHQRLAEHILAVWSRLVQEEKTSGNYTLSWGGHWRTFVDMPHYQLDRVGT